MRGPTSMAVSEFEDLLLEGGARPEAGGVAPAPEQLSELKRAYAAAPRLAPSLLVAIPIFLYPSVGGSDDIAMIAIAILASWLASAAGRLTGRTDREQRAGLALREIATLVGAGLLLAMLLGFTIGRGVPVLLVLLFSLEAMRTRQDWPSLPLDLAISIAIVIVRLDIGMSVLQLEHGPMPALLILLLTTFEGLVMHRAERATVVLTSIGPAMAPGLAVLDLLLTAIATLAMAAFLIVLTQEPLIRGLAEGTVLLALPGFVIGLACRLLTALKVTAEPLPALLEDRGALLGIVATALGLTIGAELLGS